MYDDTSIPQWQVDLECSKEYVMSTNVLFLN